MKSTASSSPPTSGPRARKWRRPAWRRWRASGSSKRCSRPEAGCPPPFTRRRAPNFLLDAGDAARLEAQVGRLALACACRAGVVQRADFQRLFTSLAAAAYAFYLDAAGVGRRAGQGVLGFE